MNKKAIGLFVTLAGMLFLVMVAPSFGHLGNPVNSGWAATTPTINGTMATGEWTDATVVNFVLEMRSRVGGALVKTLDGQFYVKNNWNTLYCAMRIINDDYEAQDALGAYDGLFILFDDNHNGVIDIGDNGEGATTWTGSSFYSHNDLYYAGASFWNADFYASKTNDGSLAFSHTDPVQGHLGNWTFEMAIPLVGTDGEAYDFNITSLPKTVGFKIWFQEPSKGIDGVYPDEPLVTQNIEETYMGETYGNLTIHPLYYLTVQTTPGGTTNPAPGTYPYPYNTTVPVQAIPNPGYAFDHWELDTVNVGSANPYSVTMDQNHTIKAFFKTIPSAPVGGISFYSLAPKSSVTSIAYGVLFGLAAVTIVISRRRKK
jgi:hypothetical protein